MLIMYTFVNPIVLMYYLLWAHAKYGCFINITIYVHYGTYIHYTHYMHCMSFYMHYIPLIAFVLCAGGACRWKVEVHLSAWETGMHRQSAGGQLLQSPGSHELVTAQML